jgi:hypothetical protein
MITELAASMWEEAGRPEQAFGLYIFDGLDERAELARSLEREVFLETFGNTPELMAEEYEAYEPSSVLVCVLDHARRVPAGMVRVVFDSSAGLKTIADLDRVWQRPAETLLDKAGIDRERQTVIDIATMAIGAEYRGAKANGLISLALYRGQMLAMLESRTDVFIATLDLIVLDLLQQRCADPFTRFDGCEPLRYLDSPSSLPVYCHMEPWGRRLAEREPEMHGILWDGAGIEPFLWAPTVDRVAAALPAA